MSRLDKAVVIICLGPNPYSSEKTLQSLMVCSGILDYFRSIDGKGYIMTINFSGTKMLQAKTPEMAEASLRDDCEDWAGALHRVDERLAQTPQHCRHCEVIFVGTKEVPSRIQNAPALCRRLKARGVRINSVMVEPTVVDPAGPGAGPLRGWKMLTPSAPFFDENDPEKQEVGSGMLELARATGGLTLFPNTEGKLAVHNLFSEMFRRWGKGYWESTAIEQPQ